MARVVVIGAGPAGIMAALCAAEKHDVTLIERNDKIGKKLYITGKGRCNVTNAKDIGEFFDFIPGNPHFLYSALYTFTNLDTMNFFEKLGVSLKVERGDRVFPSSDKSSDIINALQRELHRKKVHLMLNTRITSLKIKENKVIGAELEDSALVEGDYFIITTGGVSYPLTGSTGDGLSFAKDCGHSIRTPKPSLIPIEIEESYIQDLQGLSLKNVQLTIKNGEKVLFKDFGEMLFTHFGISGPIVLSGSRVVQGKGDFKVILNLKPALTSEELDKRIQSDFAKYCNKDFKNALNDLLPQKLIGVILKLSQIPEEKKVNLITREERKRLVQLLQNFVLTIKGLRPIAEAIVTAGGIDVKEVDPSTMKSKLMDNLYFAGEVLDVDAFTGGYNIQIAFSTGYLAGTKIGEK